MSDKEHETTYEEWRKTPEGKAWYKRQIEVRKGGSVGDYIPEIDAFGPMFPEGLQEGLYDDPEDKTD